MDGKGLNEKVYEEILSILAILLLLDGFLDAFRRSEENKFQIGELNKCIDGQTLNQKRICSATR